MIKVMIAEDNQELISSYKNFLIKDSEINVVSCTIDGKTTFEKYINIKPDILLLDLNLPIISGIEIINKLSEIPGEKNLCNIIVITGSTTLRNELLNTSKIYKIFIKPCIPEEILLAIKEIHINNQNDINIEKLNSLLFKLGFNVYTKGVRYLMDAIILADSDPNLLYNITNLYTLVSIKYNTNKDIVKWNITNAISAMNRYVDKKLLYSIFDEYDGRNLSPKYFISLFLCYLKRFSV